MSIGTKLILLLTVTIGAVMFLASFLSLRQTEAAMENALRDGLRAHSITLRFALEENYSNGIVGDARRLIDRLRENSRIYAVLVFDDNAKLVTLSQPETNEVFLEPPELKTVLETGETREFIREIDGKKYLSVITPLNFAENRRGAIEIVKPLALIENDVFNARVNWLAMTLFLLAVIFLVVALVLRRSLTKPFQSLLIGARALGRGDLSYRVELPKTGDELAFLAEEFNRMADNLREQRHVADREAENRLALERRLRHTERLASVGRLAAGIAHELGAPLNVIDARAEQLLEKKDAAPEKREKNLTIIRAQTARISRIVRQLLTLARPYDFRLAPVELNEAVAEALEQIAETARRQNVEMDFSAGSDLKISADADYIHQVFINILTNALQAMPAGGSLKVTTGTEIKNDARFAFVSFSDNGTGIAAEALEKIFDPFYTTKDIGQGTGLGLAVSHRIVEEHGGFIEAENNASGGAVFTVHLPLSASEMRKIEDPQLQERA
jgi:Signal transduction histidine kinase regulating C4-dicarboxylate transport system